MQFESCIATVPRSFVRRIGLPVAVRAANGQFWPCFLGALWRECLGQISPRRIGGSVLKNFSGRRRLIRLSTSAVTGLSLSKFLGFNSMAKAKYVYTWGDGKADGDGSMKALLGGKGANLAEMTRINLPVPPGFTITTEVCTYYYANKKSYPKELQAQMEAGVKNMEKIMGCKFGDAKGHAAACCRSFRCP